MANEYGPYDREECPVAQAKISELPEAEQLSGNELLEIVQDGENRKATSSSFRLAHGDVPWEEVSGKPVLVPQSEAEAGTSETIRFWSAQRVWQSARAFMDRFSPGPGDYLRRNSSNTDWEPISAQTMAQDVAPYVDPEELIITGNTSFFSPENEIQAGALVTLLRLDVGDVIQVEGSSSNDGVYTVDDIVNDNRVVVNYAHRGGAGPLSITYEPNVQTTITRLAKGYNAPLGLGQAWVRVLANRAINTTYMNSLPRSILLSVMSQSSSGGKSIGIYIGGGSDPVYRNTSAQDVAGNAAGTIWGSVPPETSYRVEWQSSNTAPLNEWMELR